MQSSVEFVRLHRIEGTGYLSLAIKLGLALSKAARTLPAGTKASAFAEFQIGYYATPASARMDGYGFPLRVEYRIQTDLGDYGSGREALLYLDRQTPIDRALGRVPSLGLQLTGNSQSAVEWVTEEVLGFLRSDFVKIPDHRAINEV